MTTLVVGATGATGRLLVDELLARGEHVRVIARKDSDLYGPSDHRENLSVFCAAILDMNDAELAHQVEGCSAVASCLGHNLSLKGIYGHPRRLVTEALRRLCKAIKASGTPEPVKVVLMNSAGCRNRDLAEPVSFAHAFVVGLLRMMLPPHVDNEEAADFLRTEIGQDDSEIEWVAVRPDSLIDEIQVTAYEEHPSPTRSAVFDAGTTSRINVAHFMAELITNSEKWHRWKGQMPVIYNTLTEDG